jgi:hypothetical protein
MTKNNDHKKLFNKEENDENLSGYPSYKANEDIYNKYQQEKDINPEDISKNKKDNNNKEISLGNDLDVPGSELDDKQEAIGSEDEENNYYSLGGDDHNDLDEDKSE